MTVLDDQNNNLLEKSIRNNTLWDEIPVRNQTFQINRIENTDLLLDSISDLEFRKDERLPYWAELWPSAIALAEFIVDNKDDFAQKMILEIGCGLGLVGIVATACGGNVLFTDHDEFALKFTQINFKRNFNRKASVQNMDWRYNRIGRRYDIIIGADVLYEKRWLYPVLDVIGNNLAPNGIAYIAEPNRTIARDFFTKLNRRNWYHRSILKQISVCNKLHSVTINRIVKC